MHTGGKKSEFSNQNSTSVLGKPSFPELETGVWKEIRNVRQCKKCSLHCTHFDTEGFQSYVSQHDKFCVCQWWKLCWEFANTNVALPNFWQIGIDPEDKAGSCWLEFYFHLLARPRRTESSQTLSEPAKAGALNLNANSADHCLLCSPKQRTRPGEIRCLLKATGPVKFNSAKGWPCILPPAHSETYKRN